MLTKLKSFWQKIAGYFKGSLKRQSFLVAAVTVGLFCAGMLMVPAAMAAPAAAGIGLFMVATMESFNIFSAMNSSPWTAENFGADEEKAESCRKYVWLSIGANEALGLGASLLAMSAWPLLGVTVASMFMYIIYQDALRKGMAAGSKGWANAPKKASGRKRVQPVTV